MHPILAIVTATDDPEGLGRVEVSSPEMGDYWPVWAPVIESFGASGTTTPSIGDDILIAFMHGDATRPVVLGRFKPPD